MNPKFLLFIPIILLSVSNLYAQESIVQKYLAKADEKEKEGDKRQATYFLNQAASIEWERKNYGDAIRYYEESIQLNQEINNQNGIAMISNNIGMIYADMENYEKAYAYFIKTLELRKNRQEKRSVIHAYINLSVILNKLNRHVEAASYLEEALGIARELSDAEQMRSCYGMLAETYEKANQPEKSIKYFNLYRSFHELVQREKEVDLINQAEKARLQARLLESEKRNKELELIAKEKTIQEKNQEINQREKKLTEYYQTNRELLESASKQELVINLLKRNAEVKEKDAQIKESQLKQLEAESKARILQEQIVLFFIIAAFVFLSTVLTILYLRNREKQRLNENLQMKNEEILSQNEEILTQKEHILEQKTKLESAFTEIARQNKNIKSSINYAKRIQAAVLHDKEKLAQLLPESFILFQPRDVVSGDFYWFTKVKNKILLAAADCTGHGVPGAFMSILGSSLLRQITNQGISSPQQILLELQKEINIALNQQEKKIQDGMDIALVSIDTEEKKLSFAGAHNPLVYMQNNQMYVIKGSRFSVGGNAPKNMVKSFEEYEIDVSIPTQFYLYSDGYQDQFGGKRKRKFLANYFRKYLFEIHQNSSEEQQKLLNQNLINWQGDHYQIDDILVIGVHLDLTKNS